MQSGAWEGECTLGRTLLLEQVVERPTSARMPHCRVWHPGALGLEAPTVQFAPLATGPKVAKWFWQSLRQQGQS